MADSCISWYKVFGGRNTAIKRQGFSPGILLSGVKMSELSVFLDESGIEEGVSRYYLVTLVMHNQSESIEPIVFDYERSIAAKGLANIPFHANPLKRANGAYENMEPADRKRLMASFRILVQNLPISYKTFVHKSKEFKDSTHLQALIKRDLVNFLVDELEFFQSFDKVKIYYDGGQTSVKNALHDAIEFALSKDAVIYRNPDYATFKLLQVADYLCEIELAAVKYANHDETATDVKFYGEIGAFKRNFLKQARRKLMK